MSESELVQAMGMYFGLVADMLTLYLTSTSGFLITAYLVGAKLTRQQLAIVCGLYVVFAMVASYLTVGYGLRGIYYAEQLRAVSPGTPLYSTKVVPVAIAIVLMFGIAASLKFMRDVRRRGV
ncbi:MAG: hypothetical protein R3C60_14220 [Parvularculaceae bacterium]